MATVCGYVERIKFRNEENGYSILSLTAQDEEYVLVGTFPFISEGDYIEATGRTVEHPVYGDQIQVSEYEVKTPEDMVSMERYLGSGAIKGVGAALAARIVRRFKAPSALSRKSRSGWQRSKASVRSWPCPFPARWRRSGKCARP